MSQFMDEEEQEQPRLFKINLPENTELYFKLSFITKVIPLFKGNCPLYVPPPDQYFRSGDHPLFKEEYKSLRFETQIYS